MSKVYDSQGLEKVPVFSTVTVTGSISAGTAVATLGQVVFADSNGVSFGVNGQTVTASIAPAGGALTNINVSAGTTSNDLSAITFANSNGVSFGLASSTITASYTVPGATVFSNSNNVSFGLNGSTVTASATVASTQGSIKVSAGASSASVSAVTFSNSNNVSFGLNAGTVTASATVASTQDSINVSAGTTSNNLSALTFSNSNGLSFGLNGSVITASYTVPSTAGLLSAVSLDQVDDPANDAFFLMNTRQVQFQWGSNLSSFATAATRQGLFELDVIGNTNLASDSSAPVDVLHIHQSTNNPYLHLIHVQADGTNAMPIHVEASGAVGMEINRPISFDGGSVPMILGTSQSNLVSNLNANYLQGKLSSEFLTTARASNDAVGLNTAATAVTWTVNSSGISINAGAYLTTAAASNHSHGNPTLALTNLSGTTASASDGLTLSLSAASPAGANINVSAGTTSSNLTAVKFLDSNGVSFGLNTGSVVTATVKTDYLTTAMASNRGSDFVQATAAFAGTNASGTIASNGISVSVAAGGGDAIRGIAAGASTATTNTVNFSNANGISFGWGAAANSTVLTASHNALTTARASTDAVGLNTAQTNVTWTVNSSGISLNAGGYAGTVTGATNCSVTANTSGVSVNLPAYLTTAALSNHSHGVSFTSGSVGFQTLSFTNSNGISFNSGTQGIFASHNALTTARASTDAIGLNTAATAVTWTVNSSGISLNAGAYLTTAAASNHSHGNPTLALTNLTGTTASNSGGFTLSLSAAAPGGGDAIRGIAAGGSTASTNTVNFDNSNGISFGFGAGASSTLLTASHNALTSQSNQAFSADASSTFQTLSFQNSNGVSFSNNAGALRVTHALQYTSATSAITASALNTSVSRVANIVAATNNTGGGTASLSSNVSFSAANGITFYTSAGGAIVGSHNGLTTAANSTHSHGNPTLNLTNLSGTTASASNGFTLSLSAIQSALSGGAGISLSTTGSTIVILTV